MGRPTIVISRSRTVLPCSEATFLGIRSYVVGIALYRVRREVELEIVHLLKNLKDVSALERAWPAARWSSGRRLPKQNTSK